MAWSVGPDGSGRALPMTAAQRSRLPLYPVPPFPPGRFALASSSPPTPIHKGLLLYWVSTRYFFFRQANGSSCPRDFSRDNNRKRTKTERWMIAGLLGKRS